MVLAGAIWGRLTSDQKSPMFTQHPFLVGATGFTRFLAVHPSGGSRWRHPLGPQRALLERHQLDAAGNVGGYAHGGRRGLCHLRVMPRQTKTLKSGVILPVSPFLRYAVVQGCASPSGGLAGTSFQSPFRMAWLGVTAMAMSCEVGCIYAGTGLGVCGIPGGATLQASLAPIC